MPTTQTVVMTPNVSMTTTEVLAHIANLMPSGVISHLTTASSDGHRTTSVSVDGNVHTITTTWSDDASMQTYKNLMSTVSDGVKTQLTTDGWTYSFTPETADL